MKPAGRTVRVKSQDSCKSTEGVGALDSSLDRVTHTYFFSVYPRLCGCRSYFDPLAVAGALHTKLSASFVLPTPLYRATWGYGHSGRVMSTRPPLTREARIWSGAVPASRQRSSAATKSA